MLQIYGVPEDQREELVQLARDSRQKGWWHAYGDSVQPHFATYLGLESAASEIRIYEVNLIPDLLQTEDYARAVIARGHGRPARATTSSGRSRSGWSASRPDPDRPAEGLGRPGRGRAAPAGRRPRGHAASSWSTCGAGGSWRNVSLQVIPFGGGAHPAMGRPFVILVVRRARSTRTWSTSRT